MPDWVENYIHNEGGDVSNHAFGFTSNKIECGVRDDIAKLLMAVIRQCASKEGELNEQNFKKLKITVVNEYCFNTIERLELKKNSKYSYIVLIPQDVIMERNETLIKHKLAHEIAHFLCELKGLKLNKAEEERECHRKTKEWDFPDPELLDK